MSTEFALWRYHVQGKIDALPECPVLWTERGAVATTQRALYAALANCRSMADLVALNAMVSNRMAE